MDGILAYIENPDTLNWLQLYRLIIRRDLQEPCLQNDL